MVSSDDNLVLLRKGGTSAGFRQDAGRLPVSLRRCLSLPVVDDFRPYAIELRDGFHDPNPVSGIPAHEPRRPCTDLVGYLTAAQLIHPLQRYGDVEDPVFRREPSVPGKRFGEPRRNRRQLPVL